MRIRPFPPHMLHNAMLSSVTPRFEESLIAGEQLSCDTRSPKSCLAVRDVTHL